MSFVTFTDEDSQEFGFLGQLHVGSPRLKESSDRHSAYDGDKS